MTVPFFLFSWSERLRRVCLDGCTADRLARCERLASALIDPRIEERESPAGFPVGSFVWRLVREDLVDGAYQKRYPKTVVDDLKRLPAYFYRTDSGREPVRDWLKSLPAEDRKVLGEDIKDVEFSWPIGMPLVRSLGNGVWEVRSSLARGRIARVLFSIAGERMILLHGFVKKTRKTPKQDIDLALKRLQGETA